MSKTDTLTSSRPLGVAQQLAGTRLDADTVYSRLVVLTGDAETLSTQNGKWCIENCIRLLPRVVGDLLVALPQGLGAYTKQLRDLAQSVWSQRQVRLVSTDEVDFGSAVAILNVGHDFVPSLPWTSINSNGWVARCSSSGRTLPKDTHQPNPLGAMFAASLGITEVFKRVYGVPVDRGPACDLVQFSLFELSDSVTGVGPQIPECISLNDTMVVGAGAIGNGIALLMAQLPVQGRALVVDNQLYAPENLATCCLLDGSNMLNRPKAHVLAEWLNQNSKLSATGEPTSVSAAIRSDAMKAFRVDLVINGLDNVDARHDAQALWPSLTVDGGINSIGAAVVTHSLAQPRWGCLRCTFTRAVVDDVDARSTSTGLHPSSLRGDPTRQLTQADIDNARPETRDWLQKERERGAILCSVLPPPKAESALGLSLDEDFLPSVPFVATASAALVMAQVLKNLCWPKAPFVHQFQLADLFARPSEGQKFFKEADKVCECVRHRASIVLLAQRRAAAVDTTPVNRC